MNDTDDEKLDALLRRQFEGPVPDEGFSERVMQRVTPRRRMAWPLWSGVLLGAAACASSLVDVPLLHAGWRDWQAGALSAPLIGAWLAMLALAWLALGWGLTESADR